MLSLWVLGHYTDIVIFLLALFVNSLLVIVLFIYYIYQGDLVLYFIKSYL